MKAQSAAQITIQVFSNGIQQTGTEYCARARVEQSPESRALTRLLWAEIRCEPSVDFQAPIHCEIHPFTAEPPTPAPSHTRLAMIYALDSFVFRAFTHVAEGKASKKSPVGIDTSAMNKMMKNFDKC